MGIKGTYYVENFYALFSGYKLNSNSVPGDTDSEFLYSNLD